MKENSTEVKFFITDTQRDIYYYEKKVKKVLVMSRKGSIFAPAVPGGEGPGRGDGGRSSLKA